MHSDATEAEDIAAEVLNLITRRLMEGTPGPVLCLGLARGIALTASHPDAPPIAEVVRRLLDHFATPTPGGSDA